MLESRRKQSDDSRVHLHGKSSRVRGAIYNGDENGASSNPHLEGCQFLDNGLAQGLGGAIYTCAAVRRS